MCHQSLNSECDIISGQEESEPLAYKSPDLDVAPSRRAYTFFRKGRLIKPIFRYSSLKNKKYILLVSVYVICLF